MRITSSPAVHDARPSIWRRLVLFTSYIVLLLPGSAGATDFTSAGGTVTLRYERGLLAAEIEQATFAEILAALRQLPDVRVRTVGMLSDDRRGSVVFHPVPLVAGIRAILRDRSYVLQEDGGRYTVDVLLAAGTEHRAELAASRTDHTAVLAGSKTPAFAGGARPLDSRQVPDPGEDLDSRASPDDRAQTAPARREARLTDALAALHSAPPEAQAEVLDRLAYSGDARAIEALTQVATGTFEAASAIRVQAAAALARHALHRSSADPSLVSVLEQLAGDGNATVRAVARQTLEDLEQRQE